MPEQATPSNKTLTISSFLFILYLSLYSISYIYIQRYVEGKTEWFFQNPLSMLLVGKSSFSEGFNFIYDPISRAYLFIQSLLIFTLGSGIIRYSRSGGARLTLLAFSTGSIFFMNLSSQLMFQFKNISGISYLNESADYDTTLFVLFKLFSLLILVVAGLLLVLIKKETSNNETEYQHEPALPLKWMRLLHFFTDRILVFFPTAGYLLIPYFYIKYKGMPSSYNKEPQEIFEAAGVGFLVVLALSYIITEAVLKFSPAKTLTGTRIISTETGKSPSIAKIFVRSLCRFIPLNLFSFWFSAGWHDTLSGTTLTYTGKRPWLLQQTLLTKSILVLYATILGWLFVSAIAGELFYDLDFIERDASELPLFLAGCGVLVVLPVLAVYLASIYNYTDNLIHNNEFADSAYFTEILLCFIPVYNLITCKNAFLRIEANIEYLVKEDEQLDKLKSTTATLNWLFPVFYLLFCLSVWGFFTSDYRGSAAVCAAMAAFFLFFIIVTFISYLGSVKHLAPLFQLNAVEEQVKAE